MQYPNINSSLLENQAYLQMKDGTTRTLVGGSSLHLCDAEGRIDEDTRIDLGVIEYLVLPNGKKLLPHWVENPNA